MASPQEVIEAAIPHPADSTPESRLTASTRVMQALAANDYTFVRRRSLTSRENDGECAACHTELVHVDHGPVYSDAMNRMSQATQKMAKLEAILGMIAAGHGGNPVELAKGALA